MQPLLVHRARESEDFTHNKSDETDAMIIARVLFVIVSSPNVAPLCNLLIGSLVSEAGKRPAFSTFTNSFT